MNPQEIKKRIDEYYHIHKDLSTDEPSLAETALFVEEVFDLVLPDEEISAEYLGNIPAIEQLVLTKLEQNR